MTIHWRAMNADAKIEAIKTVWQPGISASQIAAHFEGVTRNAVIGVYNRYPDKLAGTPLEGKGGPCTPGPKLPRPPRLIPVKRASQPLKPAREYFGETQLVGRPLMMLRAQECKWPLTDLAKGAGAAHLFCALPAEGPYCAHHARRSVAERRA